VAGWNRSGGDGILNNMNRPLRTLRRTVASLPAEDRKGFKRIDASPALYDDGSWLKPNH
jgi:hypothetical protein